MGKTADASVNLGSGDLREFKYETQHLAVPSVERFAGRALSAGEVLNELAPHAGLLHSFGVDRLGLIGSTLRNEARPDSDLDFVVDLRDKYWRAYCDVKHFLEDLFGREVDLIMRSAIKPRWRSHLLGDINYVEGLDAPG
ncbi:nucleotidyltransferase domain-containing protein [bacterium]|nr:nucleotidyltransferase domain-containing protein [bacterium]